MKAQVQEVVTFIAAICFLLGGTGKFTFAQGSNRYEGAHIVAQKTNDDLNRVVEEDPEKDKGKSLARINAARKSLSDLNRNLSNNQFDKRLLDSAIKHVNDVLKHNTLGGHDRDALDSDLYDLRRLRKTDGK